MVGLNWTRDTFYMQARIPAVFIRGGTSKGVFFHAKDLPADPALRDRILARVLGSPDPNARQLDGMGGGISSLSKAVIVGPSTRDDADIDYTFAQVAVDRELVDYKSNCGNLSSAVGPFCVDEGLLARADGEALVRIHNTNTRKVIHARFTVTDGIAEVEGDFELQGVSGTGSEVKLDFLEPGGAVTGKLLPTGAVTNEILDETDGKTFQVSIVDACNATLFLRAGDLGIDGTELPDALEAIDGLMDRIERLRTRAGVLMGLGATPEEVPLSNPKVAMVSNPTEYRTLDGSNVTPSDHDILVRAVSMERIHRATPLTTGMSIAAAALIPGTLAAQAARITSGEDGVVRVGHPSGVVVVGADVQTGDNLHVGKTTVYRTARRLMEGSVLIPGRYAEAAE